MAKVTSGSFNTSGYQGRYLNFSWTATQSVAENKSTISWTLKGAGTATSSYYKAGNFKVVIAGETVYSSSTRINLYNGTTVASGTKVITHNTNGSKSFSASAEAGIYTVAVNCTGSGSWELTDIPRAATITNAPNFNDEANPTITFSNPAGSAAKLSVCISLDGSSQDIAYRDVASTATSYTFNLTEAERNILRNATTTSNSRSVRFYIRSNIGGTNYYKYLAKTLTIVNAAPTLTPVVEDRGTASTVLTGDKNKIIKAHNYIYAATGAKALKGATIKSQSISCDGNTIKAATGTFTNVNSASFVFTVTDSRGNTTKQTVNKTLIDYIKLTCTLNASPATTDGVLSFSVTGNYFAGNFGAVANNVTVEYRYKVDDGSYSNWVVMPKLEDVITYTATATLDGLDYRSTYTIQARATDKIYTGGVTSLEKALKTTPVFDWGANDFRCNVAFAAPSINGFTFGEVKKLWGVGAIYMTANQTITLTEKVSSQANGIVLVWSAYADGVGKPYDWNYTFIPKYHITVSEGSGVTTGLLTSSNVATLGSKYVYVYDDRLEGNDNNSNTITSNGITYKNNYWVLRAVLGV